jgi:hypothetical protein
MTAVNGQFPTVTRSRWGEAFTQIWSKTGGPGDRTDAELLEIRRAFDQLRNIFDEENTAAYEAWIDLMQATQEERADLAGSDFLEDVAALEILEEEFNKTTQRVDLSGAYLVPEDLISMHHMLQNQTHIAGGARAAAKEMEKRRKLEKEFEDEEEEDPGLLETAWDVVGWDSPGDFAADVLLTIFTGGLGKVTKVVVKGRKAKKKLDKVRALNKARKLRNAKRLERLVEGATRLVKAVAEQMEKFDAPTYVDWIKKNWKKTLKAYATDELGVTLSNNSSPTEAKNLLQRLSKDSVGEYVSRMIGSSSSDEASQLRAAAIAYAAGLKSTGMKEFRRYLVMNLKRRGLTNAVYYGARVSVGESNLTSSIIVDVGVSTAGEMAQDFVNQVPGVPTTLVETARKSIQNNIADSIKSALA